MTKNKLHLAVLLVGLWAVFCVPSPSYAYDFVTPTTIAADGEVCPGIGFTHRIMTCVKETIISTVNSILVPFSTYFSTTIAAFMTLVVAAWGIRVLSGERTALRKDGMMLVLKIGAVMMFTSNFGGFFPKILDAMEGMLTLLTNYVLYSTLMQCPVIDNSGSAVIWDRVDCALEILVGGVYSPWTLFSGITGFLVAALFSQTVGFFIGVMGFALIAILLFSIARAMYIFIAAWLAFAMMVLISPMFIPLMLLKATSPYFQKWLRLTIGFTLQPIFVFAYLAMLLAAFDSVVYSGSRSLYRTIAGTEAFANTCQNATPGCYFKIGDWMHTSGAYWKDSVMGTSVAVDERKLFQRTGAASTLDTGVLDTIGEQVVDSADRWKSGIYKYLGLNRAPKGGINQDSIIKIDVPATEINWGVLSVINGGAYDKPEPYLVKVFLSLLMALVTTYIFMTMLQYLPFIGAGISGESLSMPVFGSGNFSVPGQGMVEGLQNRFMGNFGGGKTAGKQ